jgi:hypothetical protein
MAPKPPSELGMATGNARVTQHYIAIQVSPQGADRLGQRNVPLSINDEVVLVVRLFAGLGA